MTTKKFTLKKNNYTRKQKTRISDKIYNISNKDVLDDFNNLVKIGCDYHKTLSKVGNDVVNKYTAAERLNTMGMHHLSFYDVWFNKLTIKKQKYARNFFKFYRKSYKTYPEIKIMFRLSNLYFSAVSIFKPLVAMDVYCRFKPNCILDFTMGWGGRLVGACALNIPKYIGIDNNNNLKTPYNKMTSFLKKHSTTDVQLFFQDALTVDYSKLKYDLVLTSPPYYNIETYGDNKEKEKEKEKEDWDNNFYIPIFKKTFQYLKKGGYFCLNIPTDVYENVAIDVLGKPFDTIKMPKAKRTSDEKYCEYIYIWYKN